MYKIVFDSDGLIKLVKAGIFDSIKLKCIISQQVYREAVVEGKKQLYQDAFEIEKFIKNKKITVIKITIDETIPGLGKGELSTLLLFKKLKAHAIISDDRKFLKLLDERQIAYIVPTEAIVGLASNKHLEKEKAIQALNKIKNLVRKENYESAVNALGGEK